VRRAADASLQLRAHAPESPPRRLCRPRHAVGLSTGRHSPVRPRPETESRVGGL